jgi:hypothetical protein
LGETPQRGEETMALTPRENRIVENILNGTARRRRILVMVVLFVLFVVFLCLTWQRDHEMFRAMRIKADRSTLAILRIQTHSDLEARLKTALASRNQILGTLVLFSLLFVEYLKLCLVFFIFGTMVTMIALTGARDNIIKKLKEGQGTHPS